MIKILWFVWSRNQAKKNFRNNWCFFLYRIQRKENRIKNEKDFNCSRWGDYVVNKNESEVHEKTVRTAIKQDLSPGLNPFVYAIWGPLENKTNATSHPNIGLLKTAIEKEWKKIFEEFILKACKSFLKCVDTIIEKTMAIMNKFTVLCESFL